MTFKLKKKNILLDTCILEYFENKELGPKVINVLDTLIKQENILAISEYTIYEILRGVYKAKEEKLLKEALLLFKRYLVDFPVLIASARLCSLYNEENIIKRPDGDEILSATTILIDGLILTANGRDFPPPFFIEKRRWYISYGEKVRKTPLILYLLKSDIPIILSKLNLRK